MKGISGNVSDAYQRFAVKSVNAPTQQSVGSTQQTTRAASPEAAKVSISSQARDMASSGVNTQKVESLKAAIADGSFKVNSQVVAQRILDGFGA
jgi:negative regulator of flagellin synthesis FlgM